MNSNAKWQLKSDAVLTSLFLMQSSAIPQMFIHLDCNVHVDLSIIKNFNDIFAPCTGETLRFSATEFGHKFDLGKINHGLGRLRFFRINIVQHEKFSFTLDVDDNLQAIEQNSLSRVRRRQCEKSINSIELTSFMSINFRISWLLITSLLLCAFHPKHLQQKIKDSKVSALTSRVSASNQLKRYGKMTNYPIPPVQYLQELILVAFADASRSESRSQVCYILVWSLARSQKVLLSIS